MNWNRIFVEIVIRFENMTSKIQLEVENKLISIVKQDEQDYICLTDMVRDEEGTDHIRNWMRNRNTVEFIGL
jgi:hypothetical protein